MADNKSLKSLQEEENKKAGMLFQQARHKKGLSQEDLSYQAGIEQSTLSKVERLGPKDVSWQKLCSIAETMGYIVEINLRHI